MDEAQSRARSQGRTQKHVLSMAPAKRRKTSTSSPPAPGNASSDVRNPQPARAQRDLSSPDADLDLDPEVLLCPITRVMFRDPVIVVE